MKVASVAPDGSPVELYRNLPSFGEAEIVSGAIAPNASVLELGCGTGRMTARLVSAGIPSRRLTSRARCSAMFGMRRRSKLASRTSI